MLVLGERKKLIILLSPAASVSFFDMAQLFCHLLSLGLLANQFGKLYHDAFFF